MTKKRRPHSLTRLAFVVFLLTLGLAFVLAYASFWRQKQSAQAKYHKLQKTAHTLSQENRQLRRRLQRIRQNPNLLKLEAYKLLLIDDNHYMIRFLGSGHQNES
jgi:cell division protein FtsB